MLPQELFKNIKNGRINSLYCFFGEEELLIEEAVNKIKNKLLHPKTKDFDFDLIHVKEGDGINILTASLTLPLTSPKRVVIIKDAERLSQRDIDDLTPLIENPPKTTVVIFLFATLKTKTHDPKSRIKELISRINKTGSVVEFKKLYRDKMVKWLEEEVKKYNKKIYGEAIELFIEIVGKDLRKLKNELQKLILYMGDKEIIESSDIKNIVESTVTRSIFELTDSIGKRDLNTAIRILREIFYEGEHHLSILTMIVRHFRLLWIAKNIIKARGELLNEKEISEKLEIPMFLVPKILNQTKNFSSIELKEYLKGFFKLDIKIKRSGLSPWILLEKLIIDSCLGSSRNNIHP